MSLAGSATACLHLASSTPLLTPFVIVGLALAISFLLSAALGANDVANALGTSVGTGAVSIGKALAIGAVCEFSGAVLFGSSVTRTISSGVVTIGGAALSSPPLYMLGMLSVLVGCTLWLSVATRYGLPVSSTHSVVGCLVGLGVVSGWSVQWSAVGRIALSWVVSPLIGGLVAWLLFTFIQRNIIDAPRPTRAMRRCLPLLCGATLFLLTLFLQIESEHPLGWTLFQAVAVSVAVASLGAGMAGALTSFIHSQSFAQLQQRQRELARRTARAKAEGTAPPPVDAGEAAAVILAAFATLQDDEEEAEGENGGVEGGRVATQSRGEDGRAPAAADAADDVQLLPTSEDVSSQQWRGDGVERPRANSANPAALDAQSRKRQHDAIEQVFSMLQVLTACFVSFSHGSNDVSNAVGPLASILAVYTAGAGAAVVSTVSIPHWVLVLGGVGISVGLGVWGRPVMDTVGKKITHLVPTRGFCVELATALTVLMATQVGMPVSTTHTLIGSIVAMGLATGHGGLNRRVLLNILLSWFVTVPISALLTSACFLGLRSFV